MSNLSCIGTLVALRTRTGLFKAPKEHFLLVPEDIRVGGPATGLHDCLHVEINIYES